MTSTAARAEYEERLRATHATNLRVARARKRVQQSAVAAEVGVAQQTLSSWEAGRAPVPDIAKVLLAKALDVPAAELFPLVVADLDPVFPTGADATNDTEVHTCATDGEGTDAAADRHGPTPATDGGDRAKDGAPEVVG